MDYVHLFYGIIEIGIILFFIIWYKKDRYQCEKEEDIG